jgi:hypothetical protein
MKAIALAILLVPQGLQLPRAEAEIHLIPSGFSGWVAIAFGAGNGEALRREGDARLYRIPAAGVLMTPAALNLGSSPAWSFYFEAADGTRSRIMRVSASGVPDTPENRADATIGVFGISRMSASAPAGCRVDAVVYFVGTATQFLDSQTGPRSQQLARALVTGYRCP